MLWLDIPEHLSVNLESIQKRALMIVFPDYSYDEALTLSGLESLEKRRLSISRRSISAWRLRTRHEVISVPYDLRSSHEALTLESKKRMILLPLNFETSFITPITFFIIHSKYFPNSDWLTTHA